MGSGSTLAFPAYNNWPHFYLREVPNTIVVYTGTGSGEGIKDVTLNNTDFGDSDAPLTSAQLQVILSLSLPPPDFLFIIRPLVTPSPQFIAVTAGRRKYSTIAHSRCGSGPGVQSPRNQHYASVYRNGKAKLCAFDI